MDDIVNQLNGIIPQKYLSLLTALFVGSQVFGRIVQSIRSGGGLRSIIRGIWFGTNAATPKQNAPESGIADKLTMLLLTGLLAFGAMTTLSGCTNPQTREAIVFNTFKDTWTVAHAAYQAHCENVVTGKVSKEKEIKVDAAWNKFRLTFKTALALAHQDWNQMPPASLDVAEKQLLQLIRTL